MGVDDDFEMDHCFNVKAFDPETNKIGSTLFKATEDSSCCSGECLYVPKSFLSTKLLTLSFI